MHYFGGSVSIGVILLGSVSAYRGQMSPLSIHRYGLAGRGSMPGGYGVGSIDGLEYDEPDEAQNASESYSGSE